MQKHKPTRPSGPAPTSIDPQKAAALLNSLLDMGKGRDFSKAAQARAFKSTIGILYENYFGSARWLKNKDKDGIVMQEEARRLKEFFTLVAFVLEKSNDQ